MASKENKPHLQYRDAQGRSKLEIEIAKLLKHKLEAGDRYDSAMKFICDEFQNNQEPINNHFGTSYKNWEQSE